MVKRLLLHPAEAPRSPREELDREATSPFIRGVERALTWAAARQSPLRKNYMGGGSPRAVKSGPGPARWTASESARVVRQVVFPAGVALGCDGWGCGISDPAYPSQRCTLSSPLGKVHAIRLPQGNRCVWTLEGAPGPPREPPWRTSITPGQSDEVLSLKCLL